MIRILEKNLIPCFILGVALLNFASCDSDDDPVSSESIPPAVHSVVPAPDSTGVSTVTDITVIFSEPIDPSSVTILINGLTRGSLTIRDSVAIVSLADPLLAHSDYEAAVLAGVKDLAGNTMDTTFTWTFTTDFGPLGEAWAVQPSPTNVNLNSVVRGPNEFFAVGEAGTMFTSPTGVAWSVVPFQADADQLWAAFPIGERYAVAGSPGTIVASVDPISWTQDTLADTINELYDLWVGFDGIYMVGTGGETGTDGILVRYLSPGNWSSVTLGAQITPRSVTRFGGTWVVVGDGGLILTSNDGNVWVDHGLGPGRGPFNTVRWVSQLGVLVAVGGGIATSENGTDWQLRTAVSTQVLRDFAWTSLVDGTETQSLLCAVGDDGLIMTSTDGISWTQQQSGVAADLYGISQGSVPSRFIVVGENGTILTSD